MGFSTVAVYRTVDGYLAVVCDSSSPLNKARGISANELKYLLSNCKNLGKFSIMSYKGDCFGTHFEYIGEERDLGVVSRSIKSRDIFARYIKEYNPCLRVNPLEFDSIGVCVDLPYIGYNGVILCKWSPYFERSVKLDSFNIDVGKSIFSYHFKEPMFILEQDSRRHTQVSNEEILSINLKDGYICRSIKYVSKDCYSQCSFVFKEGNWVMTNKSITLHNGYKKGR